MEIQELILNKEEVPSLELIARQVVEGSIIGMHKSPFYGFSVEFAEHRLYNVSDNLRHVDWKVFGRSDKLFTKKYEEETNLRCCIAIDDSSSMDFKADKAKLTKKQVSFIGASILMEVLKRQMDARQLALFNSEVHYLSKAATSMSHHRNLIYEMQKKWLTQASNTNTNLVNSLHQLSDKLHRRSLVIIFSDFLQTEAEQQQFFDALHHMKFNKHEVLLFMVGDKELEWDFEYGNAALEMIDLESNQHIQVQSNEMKIKYAEAMSDYIEQLRNKCQSMNIGFELLDINHPIDINLRNYFLKPQIMM